MFLRKATAGRDPLSVAMSGVRMGERLLQIGVSDPTVTGTLAAKTGISGNAVTVVENDRAAVRARRGAERAAALMEVRVAPFHALPFEPASFDVVVVHAVERPLAALPADARASALRECHRVLRPGGRALVIEAGTRAGLGALFRSGKKPAAHPSVPGGTVAELERAGFTAARLLADREGLLFTEGLKS